MGLALVLAATVMYVASAAPRGPELRLASSGAMSVTDSLGGGAILTTSAMAPGRTETGTVTITNTGDAPGELSLSAGDGDANGLRDRLLLDALELQVEDTTEAATAEVYTGTFDRITPLAITVLEPGAARTFRFSATLPAAGAGDAEDNVLQQASGAVAYTWTLTQTGPPPVTTTGPATPTTPAPSTPALPDTPVAPIVPDAPAPPSPADLPAGTPNGPFTVPEREQGCELLILGGNRSDRLLGTARGDRIYGRGGADRIEGRDGPDCLYGAAGSDSISGGAGADRLVGSTGRDRLTGGSGHDRLLAGSGNDTVYARDGERDIVDCGRGRDTVVADRIDVLQRCERRILRRVVPPKRGTVRAAGPTSTVCRVTRTRSSAGAGRSTGLWWAPLCTRRTPR